MKKPYQLLVATHSFVGMHGRTKRFKTANAGFVPVFGKKDLSATSLGATRTHSENNMPASAPFASQCELPLFGAPASAGSRAFEPSPESASGKNMNSQIAEDEKPPAVDRPGRFAWGRCVLFGGLWRRRTRSGGSGGAPVQGEFGLTMVRVVRNDLADADIEVVQPDAAAGQVGERAKDDKRQQGFAWRRWASRLFGRAAVPSHG